jgi:ADP-ribose pyrophosphatase YjhB (NUDIX family)
MACDDARIFWENTRVWLFTTIGFFSVVQKAGTKHLTVRSRVRADLDGLRKRYMPELGPTMEKGGTDYPYRATIDHEKLALGLAQLVREISYANFKNETDRVAGHGRAAIYGRVWQDLLDLAKLDTPVRTPAKKSLERSWDRSVWSPTSSKAKTSYGGVVIDDHDRILLYRPKNSYGGYAWTYPKGDAHAGEKPEQAALREVLEESGIEAKIVAPIPGFFLGDTTQNVYFLMAPVNDTGTLGDESEAIAWATPTAVKSLIAQSTTEKGRRRDAEILKAALEIVDEIGRKSQLSCAPAQDADPRR